MWRVFFDTNVFISYLLNPIADMAPSFIMRAAMAGDFRLLVSSRVVDKLALRVRGKPYLAARISPADVDAFVAHLRQIAEILPEQASPLPAVGRDRNDDYIVAHVRAAEPDFVVSGDDDLVSLGTIGNTVILRPAQFAQLLADTTRHTPAN